MKRLSEYGPGTRVFVRRPADRWIGVEVLDRHRPGDPVVRVAVVWTNGVEWLEPAVRLEVAADALAQSRLSMAELLWRSPAEEG